MFTNVIIFCLLIMRRPLIIRKGLVLLPAAAFACFINILFLYSPDLEGKVILHHLSVLLDVVIVVSFSFLVMEATRTWDPSRPRVLAASLAVPALVSLALLTDPWLHLYNESWSLGQSPFMDQPVLLLAPALFDLVWEVYAWSIGAVFTFILVRHVHQNISRSMALIVLEGLMVGFSIIVLSYFVTQLNDIYISTLAYSLAVAIAFLFSFLNGVFDLVPMGRQRMLDLIKDSIVVVDPGGSIIDLNQACQSYLGRQVRDIIGQPFSQAFSHLQGFDAPFDAGNRLSLPGEVTDPSGRSFEVMVEGFRFGRSADRGYLVELHDVTERMRMEMVLREAEAQRRTAESERRYRTVVDNQTEAIVSFAPNGDVTFGNKVVESYLERLGSSLSGLNVFEFLTEKDVGRVKEMIATLNPDRPVGEFELELARDDGRALEMLWRMKGICDDRGELQEVQAVGIDVTERRLMERELAKNQRLESLGGLAGGIAHDFNNMLAAVVGNMEIALRELPEGSRPRNRLQESVRSAMRARNLTQQLLTFSKGGEPIKEVVDLPSFIISSVEFMLAGSAVKAVYDIEEGLHLVSADPIQFEQVLNNLVMNAVQAMPEGGRLHVSARNIPADIGLPL